MHAANTLHAFCSFRSFRLIISLFKIDPGADTKVFFRAGHLKPNSPQPREVQEEKITSFSATFFFGILHKHFAKSLLLWYWTPIGTKCVFSSCQFSKNCGVATRSHERESNTLHQHKLQFFIPFNI